MKENNEVGDDDSPNSHKRLLKSMRSIAAQLKESNKTLLQQMATLIQSEERGSRKSLLQAESDVKDSTNRLIEQIDRLSRQAEKPPKWPLRKLPIPWQKWITKWIKPPTEAAGTLANYGAVLLSIISFYYAVAPKIDVSIGPSLSARDPFATAFSLKNDGVLRLYDVKVACDIIDAVGKDGSEAGGAEITGPDATVPTFYGVLNPGAGITNDNYKKSTNFCNYGEINDSGLQLGTGDYAQASIVITVAFKQIFNPFCNFERFYFETEQASEGDLIWGQQPFIGGLTATMRDGTIRTAEPTNPCNPPLTSGPETVNVFFKKSKQSKGQMIFQKR